MPEQIFELTVTAVGEVRDQDGNLVSSEPITGTTQITAAQARGLTQGEPS